MYEAAGEAAGIRCFYQLIEVAGASPPELARLLEGVRRLGFSGVNVTFPYKEAVVPLLDELSPGARAIGAVNTVVVQGGRLVGHNTDATGFRRAIGQLVEASGRGPIAVIGAGGVGKAIAFALAELAVSDIRVFDADPAKTADLAARVGALGKTTRCASIPETLAGAVGLVNATPVGMAPDRGTPVPVECLHEGLFVADAVYSPLWTPLLRSARVAGASTMTGRDLNVYQAADAFGLFTGASASVEALGAAFDRVMAARERAAS
jgi:shikimate dehydrogenase